MRILIDMNLPPRWVGFFTDLGIDSLHWSTVGNIKAPDFELLQWARQNNCIVFTHDLDFGVLLSLTQEGGPSVIQVRTQDVTPESIGALVATSLKEHAESLEKGAILSIQQKTSRVRVLPIEKPVD
jgi:predicted nuclease of predicted toxin-antitoxin system